MTDMPHPHSQALLPAPAVKKFWSFGRYVRIALLTILIVLAALPIGLHFCPWFIDMHAGVPAGALLELQAQLDATQNRMTALEAEFNDLKNVVTAPPVPAMPPEVKSEAPDSTVKQSAADIAHMRDDMVALSAAVAALQTQMKAVENNSAQSRNAAQALLASAISFIQLREAALSGHGFKNELTALRDAARGDTVITDTLAKIEPYAARGAPTLAMLHEDVIAEEATAATATEKAAATGWWQRVLAEIRGLVSVRHLHAGHGDDAFGTIENDLAEDDAAAALDDFKTLSPEAQKVLADWHEKLMARQTIDEALRPLTAHFTTLPSVP